MTLIANFLPYGPTFASRKAAVDALEDYYATGELSQDEVARIEKRSPTCRSRFVILLQEDMT